MYMCTSKSLFVELFSLNDQGLDTDLLPNLTNSLQASIQYYPNTGTYCCMY